jgi:hypothetical protein
MSEMIEKVSDNQYTLIAQQYHQEGKSKQEIEDILVEKGLSRTEAVMIAGSLISNKYEKKRKRGFLLIGIGSFLLVFGFVLTVIMYHNGMPIELAMYGPTMVGALFLLGGLIYIFE